MRLFAEFTVRFPDIIRITWPFWSRPFELFETRFEVVAMTTCHDAFIDHNLYLESYLLWMLSHLGPSPDTLCTGVVLILRTPCFRTVNETRLIIVHVCSRLTIEETRKTMIVWTTTICNGFSFASEQQFYRLYRSA